MSAKAVLVVVNNCRLCALDFCICSPSSLLPLLLSACSSESSVPRQWSSVWRHRTATMLLSLPPLGLFFFPLLYDNVPWQRPWRHRRPNEPPSSASFSRITFGIGRESWGVAHGIRCARSEKEEKGPDEWDQPQSVDNWVDGKRAQAW